MSFWNTSDGNEIEKNDNYDAGGGFLEPIPEGTSALAAITEAGWAEDTNKNRYVLLKWAILAPEEYKSRMLPHKLWIGDDEDPQAKDGAKKRDKAKRMLAAIDTNAGGKLLASDKMPDDLALTKCLANKQMVIKIMEWEQTDRATGDIIRGNWVGAVSPKVSAAELPAAPAPKERTTSKSQTGGRGRVDDDEIPF